MTEALVCLAALVLVAGCCGHCWGILGQHWQGLVAAAVVVVVVGVGVGVVVGVGSALAGVSVVY